ncbi:unnamed protein product, partial [Cyprideis torosa]
MLFFLGPTLDELPEAMAEAHIPSVPRAAMELLKVSPGGGRRSLLYDEGPVEESRTLTRQKDGMYSQARWNNCRFMQAGLLSEASQSVFRTPPEVHLRTRPLPLGVPAVTR